ncbi:MAG: DUF4293 domain-containing protein [Prevotella sp.]|nr:DUF4293 domain-containing protein [Prevotella sp.]
MIQRKQTLYLLAALVLAIVCLSLPIGSVEPRGMGVSPSLYNLGLQDGNGGIGFKTLPLFVILLLTTPLTILAIFSYRKRKLQARLCDWCIVLCGAWYVCFAFYWLNELSLLGTFHIALPAFLPFVNIVLFALAHKGITDDEKLLKAADRIR